MSKIRIPLDYKEHVNRAFHELPKVVRGTLHTGLETPVYCRRVFAGDKIIGRIGQYRMMTKSTVTPVYANFRVRHTIFFEPDSNLYGFLDNNDKKDDNFFVNVSRKNAFIYPHTASRLFDIRENLYIGDDPADTTFVPDYFESQMLRAGNLRDFLMQGTFDNEIVPQILDTTASFVEPLCNCKGSLLDWLGVPVGFIVPKADETDEGYQLCLDPILTYLDYMRTYHRNTQEQKEPYVTAIQNMDPTRDIIIRDIFNDFRMGRDEDAKKKSSLDVLFRRIHSTANGMLFDPINMGFDVPIADENPTGLSQPVEVTPSPFTALNNYLLSVTAPFGGLMPTTYMPDLWRNILSDSQNKLQSQVTVTDGKITIEEFRYKNRLQMILDRFKVSGGRFSKWLETLWGVTPRKRLDVPEIIGVVSDYIGTTTVTSTAATGEAQLGDTAGKVDTGSRDSKKFTFTADQNGYLMICVHVVPEVDYFQNQRPYLRDIRFIDEFIPQMANKGYEQLPMSDYIATPIFNRGALSATSSLNTVVGKQVAWLREMTDVNRLHSDFAQFGDRQTWAAGRRYSYDELVIPDPMEEGIDPLQIDVHYTDMEGNPQYTPLSLDPVRWTSTKDLSTYVNPMDWQYFFNNTRISDANWEYQASFDIKAVRPIGRRYMPTLG